MTCDMWNLTHDMWGRWTFSNNFSSLAVTVLELRFVDNIFTKDQCSDLTNYEGVCLTAPATPGLLSMLYQNCWI